MIVDDRPQAQPAADEPTESSPLLVGQNDAVQSQLENNSWLTQFARFQRAHLALPVVFLGFMAGAVTVTTSIQILKVIACQLWYIEHDPSKIPSNGNIPEALCDAPGVQELFARIAQMAVIIDLCGGLITSSPIGTLSAKYGRRPLLIIVSMIAIFAPLVLITALYTNSLWLVFLSTVIGSIGGARPLSLLSTMFVVDVSHNPAPILSVLEGSTYFGLSLSYTLGGLITRWSRNISMVFWVQTAISASLALYIIIAVPESFGPEKRAARAAEVAADRSRGRSRDPQPSRRPSFSRSASMERVGDAAGAFARPFAFIWPRRDPVTGKRNKRLFILCIAIVLAFAGGSYVGAGFLVYSTNRFHAQPDQTGYLLSTVSGIRAVYLSILLPIVLKWGRTWYNKHHPAEASVKTESTSSQFDVHLLAFSWLADSLAVLGIALSQNLAAASACLIMTIFASSANPCISTIVSASVEPLAQGEALAAVTLVRSVAEFLSPIVLGSILSSTTNTKLPQTAFFVASICLFLAVGIVVLIRDKDRYTSPHDETLLAVDDGFIGDD